MSGRIEGIADGHSYAGETPAKRAARLRKTAEFYRRKADDARAWLGRVLAEYEELDQLATVAEQNANAAEAALARGGDPS